MSINNSQLNIQAYPDRISPYPPQNNFKPTYKAGNVNDLDLMPMQYPSLNKATSYHHDLGSQKKHYQVYYESEIARFDMFKAPQKDDPYIALAEYPRNLTTNDIQGAYAGTHKSKAVKNLEYAKSFRPEQRSTEKYVPKFWNDKPKDMLDKFQENYNQNRNASYDHSRSPVKTDYDTRRLQGNQIRGYSSDPENRAGEQLGYNSNPNRSIIENIGSSPVMKSNDGFDSMKKDSLETENASYRSDPRLNKIVSYNIISNVPTSQYKSPKLPNGYSISHDPGKLEIIKKLNDERKGIFQQQQATFQPLTNNQPSNYESIGNKKNNGLKESSDFYAGKSNAYDYINYRYAPKQKSDQATNNMNNFYGPSALKNISGLVIN